MCPRVDCRRRGVENELLVSEQALNGSPADGGKSRMEVVGGWGM